MLIAHKIALQPNASQCEYFAKACGIARLAYNWGLAEWRRQYEAGEKPSAYGLSKQLNAIKREQFPFMYEVTKRAPQQALLDLGDAFKHFFRRIKNGENPGYPRFKKKGVHDSFRAEDGAPAGQSAVEVDEKRIKLPKIGWVRMRQSVRFPGQIKQVIVSRTADRWYAAILIDTDQLPHTRKNHGVCGVDLGVTSLAVISDGRVIEGPKPHTTLLRRLRKLNKALARSKRYKGEDGRMHDSNRRKEVKRKLARLHARIANIRTDALHKLTTDLVLNHDVIGIEDLNVRGMVRNKHLARSITDQSFGEFRRQLEYKAAWYGSTVVVADRFFPSSKTCSQCGAVKETLSLSERVYRCECGAEIDRDLNAAINLKHVAASHAETLNARGEMALEAVR